MATIVELFCSSQDTDETHGFLLSEPTNSTRNLTESSNPPHGKKSARTEGGRMKQKGRNARGMCSALQLIL